MKKWMAEDWQFELTVTEGKAEHCRLGIEKVRSNEREEADDRSLSAHGL